MKKVTISAKVDADLKYKLLEVANMHDMSISAYLEMMVAVELKKLMAPPSRYREQGLPKSVSVYQSRPKFHAVDPVRPKPTSVDPFVQSTDIQDIESIEFEEIIEEESCDKNSAESEELTFSMAIEMMKIELSGYDTDESNE